MSIEAHIFPEPSDFRHFLNGGISGGKLRPQNGLIFGLHSLTLVFNTPAGTVTFDDPTGRGITLKDISEEIESDVATVRAFWKDQRLHLIEATPSTGLNLDLTGTANNALGFTKAVDSVGKVFAAPGAAAPALISVVFNPAHNSYTVITEE